MRNHWTRPGIVDRLIELRRSHRVEVIARMLSTEFNTHITSNAVLGKCYRLKLPAPEPVPSLVVHLHGPLDRHSIARLHAVLGDWLEGVAA